MNSELQPLITFENDSMIIKECENSELLIENLCQQWKADRFCDVILHVGKDTLRAHRCVLAAASTYFNSIMKGKTFFTWLLN